MSKSTSTILSALALATGLTSLAISLFSPGPTGPQGSNGQDGSQGNQGPSGETGSNGLDGEDGQTPYIGENGNWWIGDVDSGISVSESNPVIEYLPQVNVELNAREETLYEKTRDLVFNDLAQKQAYAAELITNEGFIGVSTPAELMGLSDPTGKYVLLNDISYLNEVAPSWSPINFFDQNTKIPFGGILDGAGFSISGIIYASIDENQPFDFYGLFDELKGATIQNVTIENFNLFRQNHGDMGLIAGKVTDSTLENISLFNNTVSGHGDNVGGLSGQIINSEITFLEISNLALWGHYAVGGIAGIAAHSEFAKINSYNVEIDGRNDENGGLIGSSFLNIYIDIESELFIQIGGNSEGTYRFAIGGLIGYSNRDRLFYITTLGEMNFESLGDNYGLENVGGVIGYATNTVLFWVSNNIDIDIYYETEMQNVTIKSIGGVIGATEFAALSHVSNQANVNLRFNRETLDESFYVYTEEHPIEYVGGVIGYVYASVNLFRVVNDGQVSGMIDVGGIIGSTGIPFAFFQQLIYLNEVINLSQVVGLYKVGGIMGLNDERTNLIALNLVNFAQIEGERYVGGLFGVISPMFSIKVTIKNSYNVGEIIIKGYLAGGLIGSVGIDNFNFDFPLWGEVHLYHSFNVGNIVAYRLGYDEIDYLNLGIGSIIGARFTLAYIYGVSYLPQTNTVEVYSYNVDNNTYEPSGEYMAFSLDAVGYGNLLDFTLYDSPEALLFPDAFPYRTIWDFENVWAYVPLGDFELPILRFLLVL